MGTINNNNGRICKLPSRNSNAVVVMFILGLKSPISGLYMVSALGFLAGCVLIMAYTYSSLQLWGLNTLPWLDTSTYGLCKVLRISCCQRYIHPMPRQNISYHYSSFNANPSIWSSHMGIHYLSLSSAQRGRN